MLKQQTVPIPNTISLSLDEHVALTNAAVLSACPKVSISLPLSYYGSVMLFRPFRYAVSAAYTVCFKTELDFAGVTVVVNSRIGCNQVVTLRKDSD